MNGRDSGGAAGRRPEPAGNESTRPEPAGDGSIRPEPAGDGSTRQERRAAGVLLAAGAGRRFGRPKALVPFGGQLLVERGVQLLRTGGCEPLVVVLGAAWQAVLARASLADAEAVVHHGWREGMGTSLRAALDTLETRPDVGAAVVAIVDQPLVGAEAVRRLRAAWQDGAVAAVATYDGAHRNPVLLDRSTWPALRGVLTGDEGARGFLRARPELVTAVPCDGTGQPADADTPQELAALARRAGTTDRL